MRSVVLLLLAASISFSCAQQSDKKFIYEHRPASDTSVRAPVVILLHGYGGNEKEIFTLSPRIPAGYHVFALRAPLPLKDGGYGWFNLRFPLQKHISYDYIEIKHRRKEILRFITEVGKKYRTDTTRIIFVGFSQGAITAIDLAANWSKKFWGAASLSGGMLPETRAANRSRNMSRLNFFIGHGIEDNVVNYVLSVKARDFLTSRSAKVTFRRYETGHEIPLEELNDLESWLTELLLVKGK